MCMLQSSLRAAILLINEYGIKRIIVEIPLCCQCSSTVQTQPCFLARGLGTRLKWIYTLSKSESLQLDDSASEMTCIVSSGALNFTHSPLQLDDSDRDIALNVLTFCNLACC